ncbi:hypothetical protein [Streptomyces sp. Inha503]|uniref:hypothetical protein n=1 Tax=Streptomyces sp. Inha503 TaxID=3383314 RepID=UPI0039A220B2
MGQDAVGSRSSAVALSRVGAAMSDEPGSAWQAIADAAGRLPAASPTIPGARHDMGAAGGYAPATRR